MPEMVSLPSIDRVRAPRFDTKGELIVASRTIGSDLTYKLKTQNVSRSGLLLHWDHKAKIPFLEDTLLEMTIDPESKWLNDPVFCLGKVVRTQKTFQNKLENIQFGIRIVQIDGSDLDEWDECLTNLSKNGADFFTEKDSELLHDLNKKRA